MRRISPGRTRREGTCHHTRSCIKRLSISNFLATNLLRSMILIDNSKAFVQWTSLPARFESETLCLETSLLEASTFRLQASGFRY